MYSLQVKRVASGTAGRAGVAAAICLALGLACLPARADMFSSREGYAADGSYRVHIELTPYLWLPATQTNFTLGPHGGVSGSTSTGIPTAQQLANSLHGAFMGYGLLRYGPWSAELDVDWLSASGHKSTTRPALGSPVNLNASASLVRIAPGFGYEVVNGDVGGTPLTVDARAGFAFFTWSASVSSERDLLGSADDSGSFVQPWIGTRLSIYPSPRWRLEVGGLVQGFGVGGGSWGWGASAVVSYAVTDWVVITGGFRALRSSRSEETSRTFAPATRSIDMVAYGPVIGIGFRF
jgi:hypothetical protein